MPVAGKPQVAQPAQAEQHPKHRASYFILAIVIVAAVAAAILIAVKNFNTEQDINVTTSPDICANQTSALGCSRVRAGLPTETSSTTPTNPSN